MRLTQADIMVQAEHGPIVAVVEIRNRRRLTRDEAQQVRDALVQDIASGSPPHNPAFVLVASQEQGYLWPLTGSDKRPVEFDMRGAVAKYLPAPDAWLRGEELEIALAAWLYRLADPAASGTIVPPELVRSGFVDAIRQGTVVRRQAA